MDTPDKESSFFQIFWPLINLGAIFVIIFIIFFPYVEVEVNSWLHSGHKDNLTNFCQDGNFPKPKDIKIVNFQKHRLEIRFYCFYDDKSLNQELIIHKTGNQWRIFSKKNFWQAGSFYWPLYF